MSFFKKAQAIHGERYDYSKVEYSTYRTPISIGCEKHGYFQQTPDSHLRGYGCQKCGREKSIAAGKMSKQSSTAKFIEKAQSIWGNKYDYTFTHYKNRVTPVIVHCKEHGPFEVTPAKHTTDRVGCPACGRKNSIDHARFSKEDFIRRSKQKHGDRYDYSSSIYKSKRSPITITCPDHGPFELAQANYHYLAGTGCPKCSNSGTSRGEKEVSDFLKSLGHTVIDNDKTVLKPREIDILLPDLGIAVEYNGLYWHSAEHGKHHRYHVRKTVEAESKGYRLIHIFEDEWLNQRDLVERRLEKICSNQITKVENLRIVKIQWSNARVFYEENHLFGPCHKADTYALCDGYRILGCVSFEIQQRNGKVFAEILRVAFKKRIEKGFGKILKAILEESKEIEVVRAATDRRWESGKTFLEEGFRKITSTEPATFYFNKDNKRSLTPLTGKNYRIYDCGKDIWELQLWQ